MIKKGILKSFDSSTHKATVQILGSLNVWLSDVPTSHSLRSDDMVTGRYVAVLTPDPAKPGDSIVISLWAPATPPAYSKARGYMSNGSAALTVQDVTYTMDMIDTECYDVLNEMNVTKITGTINNDEANKLVDTSKDFAALDVQVGWGVYNTTDNTHGFVTDISQAASGKLGIGNYGGTPIDIYDNGEGYIVYAGGRFTADADGYYLIVGSILTQTALDQELASCGFVKNGHTAGCWLQNAKNTTPYNGNLITQVISIAELDAGDYVMFDYYHDVVSARTIWFGERYNSFTVIRLP
jgi:hypothetical protein